MDQFYENIINIYILGALLLIAIILLGKFAIEEENKKK